MTILSPLLEIIVCPQCKGSIVPTQEEDMLICNHCQLKYPVREGIPVMMLDEAESFE